MHYPMLFSREKPSDAVLNRFLRGPVTHPRVGHANIAEKRIGKIFGRMDIFPWNISEYISTAHDYPALNTHGKKGEGRYFHTVFFVREGRGIRM